MKRPELGADQGAADGRAAGERPGGRRAEARRIPPDGRNSLHHWAEAVNPLRATVHVAAFTVARYVPWFGLKNAIYRWRGMTIGHDVAFAFYALPDIFFPELITVGDNSIIGYNSVILAHEYLIDHYRTGPVRIGRNVVIGANCTVLPGVTIGDGAVVSAMSLVNRDVPPGAVVGGVPARPLPNGPARDEEAS
ncbi:MAG: acyltransferase [Bacillota bacterium]